MNRLLGMVMLIALILLPFSFLLFGIVVLKILPMVVILITSIYFYQKNSIEKSRRKDLLKARDEILQEKWKIDHGNDGHIE
ncbi:MAG: hypothetical protein ABI778_10545 [Ignavibacteriota bacterium]